MSNTSSVPWDGITIVFLTVVVIFSSIYVFNLIATWVINCRDALRERYTDEGGWQARWPDLLGVPLWFVLEVTCLLGALIGVVLTVWLVYEAARTVRDWWHAGARRGR